MGDPASYLAGDLSPFNTTKSGYHQRELLRKPDGERGGNEKGQGEEVRVICVSMGGVMALALTPLLKPCLPQHTDPFF